MGILAGHVRVFAAVLAAGSLVGVVAPLQVVEGAADLSPLVDQLDLVGPAGSEAFGEEVVVLSNGNYVVTDPLWDDGGIVDVGAVYLYDGVSNTLISTLTGSTANDNVGSSGVTALTNGNYVVRSRNWDGAAVNVGAVTFGNGTTGINGPVTTTNSLHGTTAGDNVGRNGVTALTNGNYVVTSTNWNDGSTVDVGAATFGDGTTGIAGAVTTSNSLHGTTAGDRVGNGGVTVLTNGNYVVRSTSWDGGAVDVGAATWGDGTTGITGAVTTTNSLHGTTAGDFVGSSGVTALANGNYVVSSSSWDDGGTANVGAATFGDGTTGIAGAVTTSNSLRGTTAGDFVGGAGVTALTNGNYVVTSPSWDGGAADVGAATFADGATGITGAVTTSNSLHGTTAGDQVGSAGVTALTNGNYVVTSRNWDSDAADNVGTATFGNGTTGINGAVTTTNSLHGTTLNDRVGNGGVTALTNGNYVVNSPSWDGAAVNVGAATFADGATGIAGAVTTSNSLHGTTLSDGVGSFGVTALTNGNYVVNSSSWDGDATDVGAATFADGTTGITGAVTTSNSLHGTTANDDVGNNGVAALTNGNYVVASSRWDGGAVDVGAATFGDGVAGIAGAVTTSNSLHGTTANDGVGSFGVTALTNGDYVVTSPFWDGGTADAGAVSFGLGDVASGVAVSSANSVIGTPPGIVLSPSGLLTSGDAVPVPTEQNRVLLLRVAPFFPATPPNVEATTTAGADSVAVTFPLPVAEDLRSTPTVQCTPASGSQFTIGTTAVSCVATDSAGLTATTGFDVNVAAPDFVSVTPARLLDTRPGQSTIDDLFNGAGTRPAGSTLKLTVAGRGGVPADAVAVAFNVTAANTAANGFITVYPCDQPRPTASNLNIRPGVVVPNSVITALDPNGDVCIYTHTGTDLIVDLAGYFPMTTTFETINPARLLDTRPGQTTIDGQSQGTGTAATGATTVVQITGRAGIPADATAVAVNLTLTNTTAQMFATIWPCDTARPEASNINAAAGTTIANSAIAKLASDGTICIYTHQATDLIIDAAGWFTNISDYNPLTPARLLDTRPGATTIDGQSAGVGLRPAGTTTTLQITNRGGAPDQVATVVVNVTATQTVNPGFITVYPCDQTRPNASNLNYGVSTTVANNVIVKVSPTGTICIYNHTPTQLITDINGYLPN